MDIIEKLLSLDDKSAYEMTKKLVEESEKSNAHYGEFDGFSSLISSNKTYVRTRGMLLCLAQAKWDSEGKLKELLPKMFDILSVDKPTVVRQVLGKLCFVAENRPELRSFIAEGLNKIDITQYKDTMAPFIKKDIENLLSLL